MFIMHSAKYREISGCVDDVVPIEQGGGSGTSCGHWDEEQLQTELMTGFRGPGNVLPFSAITIGGLEDLGYTVDYNQADTFDACDLGAKCTCGCCTGASLAVWANNQFGDGKAKQRPLTDIDRPQLSQLGKETVIAFGKQQLAIQKESRPLVKDSQYEFVGDDKIVVAYEENGNYFSIMVTADS